MKSMCEESKLHESCLKETVRQNETADSSLMSASHLCKESKVL